MSNHKEIVQCVGLKTHLRLVLSIDFSVGCVLISEHCHETQWEKWVFYIAEKLLINYVNSECLSLWIQAIEFDCGLFKGDSHVNDTEKEKATEVL